eukprot:TRINITY_DN543_c2_g1_i1.p1 TRINITY_DN543_c2_g1~~TRINITY_DN543_c2_g1_i1.p1  ORF type:complete len:702 (-),score=85.29 TRINITY_DN543_c2_g1_i1:184-2289(-)
MDLNLCFNCSEIAKNKCSRCKLVKYCSTQCQKQHWTIHKQFCGLIKNNGKVLINSCPILNSEKPSRQDFVVKELLGEGNFSKVFKVHCKHTGFVFAMKQLEKERIRRLSFRHKNINNEIMMEREVMSQLNHPNIVKLYHTFQDADNLYFLYEFAYQGELWKQLMDNQVQVGISLTETRHYVGQIVCALEYLDSLSVVHRDLKPENILITKNGTVKLADFGTAKNLKDTQFNGPEFVGTPEYMSPEAIQNKDVGTEADLWALGCIVYQLLAGCLPFKGGSQYLGMKRTLKGKFEMPQFFSNEAQSLIKGLLKIEPSSRLGSSAEGGFDFLKSHPFFYGFPFESFVYEMPPLSEKEKEIDILVKDIMSGSCRSLKTEDSIDHSELVYKLGRRHQLNSPSIFNLLYPGTTNACFRRSRIHNVIGYSENENGSFDTPFVVVQLCLPLQPECWSLLVDKMNHMSPKPKVLLVFGDIGSKDDPSGLSLCSHLDSLDEQVLVLRVCDIDRKSADYVNNFGHPRFGCWIEGLRILHLDTELINNAVSDCLLINVCKKHVEWFREQLLVAKLSAVSCIVVSHHSLLIPEDCSLSGIKNLNILRSIYKRIIDCDVKYFLSNHGTSGAVTKKTLRKSYLKLNEFLGEDIAMDDNTEECEMLDDDAIVEFLSNKQIPTHSESVRLFKIQQSSQSFESIPIKDLPSDVEFDPIE